MGRFRFNHKKVGPFRLNLSAKKFFEGRNPINSVSLDAGIPNFRLWSQDGTRGLTSIDTPGQGSIRLNPNRHNKSANKRTAKTGRKAKTGNSVPFDPETGYPPLSYNPNA